MDHENRTVSELRTIVKRNGLVGYSKMGKGELIDQPTRALTQLPN